MARHFAKDVEFPEGFFDNEPEELGVQPEELDDQPLAEDVRFASSDDPEQDAFERPVEEPTEEPAEEAAEEFVEQPVVEPIEEPLEQPVEEPLPAQAPADEAPSLPVSEEPPADDAVGEYASVAYDTFVSEPMSAEDAADLAISSLDVPVESFGSSGYVAATSADVLDEPLSVTGSMPVAAPITAGEPVESPAEQYPTQGTGIVLPEDEDEQLMPMWLDLLTTALITVVMVVVLRVFIADTYQVPTGSMLETIQLGDRLIGEKITYRMRTPKAGEVVTFYDPTDPSVTLIKRVIATEGQVVDLVDGKVVVDGEELDEPYTLGKLSEPLDRHADFLSEDISYPYVVPLGCVWLMGDNRTNSLDSRYFGAVEVSSVTSHALFIFWPISDARTF